MKQVLSLLASLVLLLCVAVPAQAQFGVGPKTGAASDNEVLFADVAQGRLDGIPGSSWDGTTLTLPNLGGSVSSYPTASDNTNTVIGSGAGASIASGAIRNTLLGLDAGAAITTEDFNTLIGHKAGEFITSSQNTGVGERAIGSAITGDSNTGVGAFALFGLTTGSANIAMGKNAGRWITGGAVANETGASSIYIGTDTRASADGNSNEICIGDGITCNGSNTVTIGNSSITGHFFTAGYIHQTPIALASLGTPADGAMLPCSDCLKGSDPCSASSTGAVAFRVNGAWQCL